MDNESKRNLPLTLPAAIVIAAVIVSGSLLYKFQPAGQKAAVVKSPAKESPAQTVPELEKAVLPAEGVILPVVWGDLGKQLVAAGAVDAQKLASLYDERGQWSKEYQGLLESKDNGRIRMTRDNAGYLLNLFWALGLANKNPILDSGEMSDPRYGGAERFASTGGWTLSKGPAMEHYSMHELIKLTARQQSLVERVSKGIYRPCCGNSTHFPDCNHGMAMLAFLELMASQGMSEADMWKAALAVNSYWFPDTYMNIASYMKSIGIEWQNADPVKILGADYSSSAGAGRISRMFSAGSSLGGNGCGVGTGAPATVPSAIPQNRTKLTPAPRQQNGCGI